VTACFDFFAAAAADADEASIRIIAVTIDRVPARHSIQNQLRRRLCRHIMMSDRLLI
jgi:hypothetical protein